MLIPLSWLRDYVDIDIPPEALANRLTLAGLEVGKLHYIGVPQTAVPDVRMPPSDHLVWDREKIVWAAVREVKPHPDADRLVLAMVDYGGAELEQCVTGAPNLYAYRGQGPLAAPLYTAWAAEGAEVWDGHSDEPKRMILKEKKLRGIPNRSMVCSEKELGMSGEHEGVILYHDSLGFAPGTPLQDVLGDVLLEIELTPNLARAFSVYGIAREIAALLDQPLREIPLDVQAAGAPIEGTVHVSIINPHYTPRFVLALIRDVAIKPSPEWMQRRLRLIGQRPINNIVDVTNYVMFETGQPLHAFDYDKVKAHAGEDAPTLITRLAEAGEVLETLDGSARSLTSNDIVIATRNGVISLSAVMGGATTEVDDTTTTVLLEGANWHFISVRRTMQQHKIFTEAGTRFSRGVHPSQALVGVLRGIEMMRLVSGGVVAHGVVDAYPAPPEPVVVNLPTDEIRRILGIDLDAHTAANLLRRLQFEVEVKGDTLSVGVPNHRLDIGTGVIGQADVIEEIGRIYGYDHVPETIIADTMPPQRPNPHLEHEERARDVLVALGFRENISYRFTAPEREAQLTPPGAASSLPAAGYVEMANPIAPEKSVLRQTLLVSLLENARNNTRYAERQQTFEIGAVFFRRDDQPLPDEPRRLGLLMLGPRQPSGWSDAAAPTVDYFDMKGMIEALLEGLHVQGATYGRTQHTTFHPGRSADVSLNGQVVGVFGELHPLVARAFDLGGATVLAAEFDLDALLAHVNPLYSVRSLPLTPPVYQDIALVVPAETPAAAVEAVIVRAGGDLLKAARLFDVYAGAPIPEGHKSLAYSLTYQTDERTLNDDEVAVVHKKIVKAVERELGAKLRDGTLSS